MKRIGGNDVLQILQLSITDNHEFPGKILHHELQCQDARARLVFDFLRSWGVAAALGDAMPVCDEHMTKPERIPASELAIRACEIVDAAWSELRHRGWIFNQPTLED